MNSSHSRPRIAIVGMSALFPGSNDAGGFWHDIVAGRDLMTDVPATHWLIDDYYDPDPSVPDKTYCKRGAFLSPAAFDTLEFGLPPSMLESTDTSQLLALMVARQVLEDATAGQFSRIDRERVSVILGVASATELFGQMAGRLHHPLWRQGLRNSGLPEEQVKKACASISELYVPWTESTFPGLLGNVVAGRIANRLNLGGTNCVVDAACASSLSAVSMAVNELWLGQSDLAIAGGVDTLNDVAMYMCFSKTPALSPTGDCRPFSSKADGTMMGEGLAMLALRRLEDAERDGDAIYAVLAGIGTSSDGKSKSVYAPVAAGQAKALRRAYAAAGYGPETVEMMEAHGTGTVAGDKAEFGGLSQVFDAGARQDRQWCALGSVKSQIGHTKAAAGAAGLFKAVMALHHRVLPPTIKIDEPNPELNFETSPFYLNTQARPWIANAHYPRRASVSAFGFGGSNFHVALEEYGGPAPRPGRYRTTPCQVFLFSAETTAELAGECRRPLTGPAEERSLAALARETRDRFEPSQPVRLSIVVANVEELRSKLERASLRASAAEAVSYEDADGLYCRIEPAGETSSAAKVALLFPGQGSQYTGMGARLAMEFDLGRQAWDEAGLSESGEGARLADMVFPRPVFSEQERGRQEEGLRSTEWAQPALGAASLAYLDLLNALGVEPVALGGHSFGELTALHAAGVLSRTDFLRAAQERGRAMQAAATIPGGMTAVAAPAAEVREWIRQSGSGAVIANENEPRQTVVSGRLEDLDALERLLAGGGISCSRLNVATAFHSPIVAGAAGAFGEFLAGIEMSAPRLPVYSNSEAAPYPAGDGVRTRELLAGQISRAVRFVDQIHAMYAAGARIFVEAGPGSVLANLTRKCLAGRPHTAIALDRRGSDGVASFLHGLARLSVCGVALRYEALFGEFRTPPPAKPSKPGTVFEISGVNYGKRYPGTGPGSSQPKKAARPEARASEAAPAPAPQPAPPEVAPAGPIQSIGASVSTEAARIHPLARKITANATGAKTKMHDPQFLSLCLEIQRQTAEAHIYHQRAMVEGHTAYLRTMETFLAGLTGATPAPQLPQPAAAPLALSAPPFGSSHAPPLPGAYQPAPAPAPVFAPPPAVVSQPPAPSDFALAAAPAVSARPGANGHAASNGYAMSASPAAVPPPPAPAAKPQGLRIEDLKNKLLAVVAEKTGYPEDILDLKMDMEADLGIDSIKRVEILSAYQDAVPNLPEIKAKEMARLRTLAEVVAYVQESFESRGLL